MAIFSMVWTKLPLIALMKLGEPLAQSRLDTSLAIAASYGFTTRERRDRFLRCVAPIDSIDADQGTSRRPRLAQSHRRATT